MEHDVQNFFVILDHFLHFYPPNNLNNQNFKKLKKPASDIIALRMCTINENYKMFDSYGACYGQNYLSFWTVFCPFTPNNSKNQKFEIMKKRPGDIIILRKCTIKTIIWCMVSEIWSVTDRIFCYFGLFFALLPS